MHKKEEQHRRLLRQLQDPLSITGAVESPRSWSPDFFMMGNDLTAVDYESTQNKKHNKSRNCSKFEIAILLYQFNGGVGSDIGIDLL